MINQKSTDFELIGERILLKKDVTKSQGKILLPKELKDQTAIVVSSACPGIEPGYRVLTGQFTGTEYEFSDGVFTMCLKEHIMGIQVSTEWTKLQTGVSMELEIVKTMNGYNCKEKDNGERNWSFENAKSLLLWLKDFLPKQAGDEAKLTDE